MAAKQPPKGENVTKTFKTGPEDSFTSENQSTEEEETATSNNQEEVDLEEDDLKDFQKEKHVPYSRFKEVNDKMREIESLLEETKQEKQSSLERTIAQYEARIAAMQNNQKDEDDFGIDYEDDKTNAYSKELSALKKQINDISTEFKDVVNTFRGDRTKSQLDKLSQKFPEADINAVLGWHKVLPNSDLSDLMERSHRENNERFEKKLQALIERKKEAKNKAILTGAPRIKLKESERPKTLSEAARKLRSWVETT